MDFRNNKVLCELNMYIHSPSNYNMVERKARQKNRKGEKLGLQLKLKL